MLRRRRWLIIVAIIFFTGCVKVVPGLAGYGDKIKVLISRGAIAVDIRGVEDGDVEVRKSPGTRVRVNGRERSLPIKFYPRKDFIYVNNRPYRGTIEILESKEGLLVVDEVYIESYLVGIINNEISTKWHRDALRTQAVISRTYAVYQKRKHKGEPFHIESTVMGQVYNGINTEDTVALRAVRDTAGEILTYNSEPALSVFHSNAGGMTDSSKDVWQHDHPYLQSVGSSYDSAAPHYTWDYDIEASRLIDILNDEGENLTQITDIKLYEVTASGRVKSLIITGSPNIRLKITGEYMRKLIGYGALKSALFEVSKSGDKFIFSGRGAGHGVGLSQWGAKGMAEKGHSYKKILSHYYPGTKIEKAY